jgi:hypothetical protein
MKKYKNIIVTFLITIGLGSSLAFTSRNINIVDYTYNAAKRTIQCGQSTSIVPSELTLDANADNIPDKWSSGNTTHSSGGTKLAYIEFDLDCLSLKNAVQCVRDYYEANSTLTQDGGAINCNGCAITMFRN